MKISVIVPMFNAEAFIEGCLFSILTQKFRDFEVILIDDCSTDRTVEIVSKYTDPRIKIIQNVQKRYDWGSRNLGIQIAQGEYIYFVDHDDILLAEALEILWHGVEISHADTVHFNRYFADSNQVGTSQQNAPIYQLEDDVPPWEFIPEDVEWRLFRQKFVLKIMPWQKLIRRQFLIDHGIYFPPIWISSDSLFYFAEMCLAKKIFVVDGAGYIYRNNLKSQMHNDSEIKFQHSIENFAPFINYMEEIFAKDLVTPLSRELQLKYELKFCRDLNLYLAMKIYNEGTSIDKIDSILKQQIKHGYLHDPKSVQMLFHFAVENFISAKASKED